MVDTYLFWDGATTPSGWTLVSDSGNDFYHKFPRGASSYGGTGGTTTHTAHTGKVDSVGYPPDQNHTGYGGTGDWRLDGHHVHPAPSSVTCGSGNSLPPYRTLKIIKYPGIPSSLPSGAILIFDNTCPTGYTQYSSQDDKYIYGDSTVGSTGGAIAHTHVVTGQLPDHPTCLSGNGFSYIGCNHKHNFTITSSSGNYEPDWLGAVLGKSGSEVAAPYSSILMFGADPGRPWNIISKVGYPLYLRFIKPKTSYGSFGSYRFHEHVSISGYSVYDDGAGALYIATNSSYTGPNLNHRHAVDVSLGIADGGSPPYLDVIYARKSLSYPPKRKINGHKIDAIHRINSHTKTEMDKFTYRTWTSKQSFGGTARGMATGFALNDKFYIGTGYDLNANLKKDLWVYDPSTNAWTQKADFGGVARNGAIGFALGSYGYIGLGHDGSTRLADFWRYDPTGNSWTQKANYGGGALYCASSVVLGSYAYAGTGEDNTPAASNIWWRYDPTGNSWTQKANYGGSARDSSSAFTVGSYSYVGCGWPASGVMVKDWWRYAENTWTQMADLAGYARYGACGFNINDSGYIVGGNLTSLALDVRDAYKYNVSGNSWAGISDYGASSLNLKYMVGVGIGTEAYVATGLKGVFPSYTLSVANCEYGQRYMGVS